MSTLWDLLERTRKRGGEYAEKKAGRGGEDEEKNVERGGENAEKNVERGGEDADAKKCTKITQKFAYIKKKQYFCTRKSF